MTTINEEPGRVAPAEALKHDTHGNGCNSSENSGSAGQVQAPFAWAFPTPKNDAELLAFLQPLTTNGTPLIYGFWTCADGREVLFDRLYHPVWQRRPGQKVEPADPNERVRRKTEQRFYTDATPFEERKKIAEKVLRDWQVGRATPRDYSKILQKHIDAAASPEPVSIPLINISKWDNEPVPQQEWAVSDRIPLGKVAIFSGEGAAGKSLLQLQLSVAHVLGGEWLGVPARKGPALFVDAEDDGPVLHKRLADILRYYDNATFADAAKAGLNLASLSGQDAVLGYFNRGRIEPTPLYNKLLEMVGDLKPVMTGIASSADVYAGSEIDRAQVQQFVSLLTRLAKVGGGSVVLISHPSLTGISSGSGLSGSTAWHNSVRARFYLESVKAEEEGEQTDSNLREIHFKKNNYGPVSESIPLRYENGLFLPVEGSEFDKEVRIETAQKVFVMTLQRFAKENRTASANPGPTYAPTLFAKELEACTYKVGKNALADAMRVLLAEKKICQESYGDRPSRQRFRLVVGAGE
jgi:RecA-family ATPase